MMSVTTLSHSRQRYGYISLLGDLGGVPGVIASMIGVFVYPYASQTFNAKFLSKLYHVKTKKR